MAEIYKNSSTLPAGLIPSNLNGETLIGIADAARLPVFCTLKNGKSKPASPGAVYRTIVTGSRSITGHRVRLEFCVTPTGRKTSLEAIERFFNRLNGLDVTAPPPPTKKQRARQVADAEAVCASAGI